MGQNQWSCFCLCFLPPEGWFLSASPGTAPRTEHALTQSSQEPYDMATIIMFVFRMGSWGTEKRSTLLQTVPLAGGKAKTQTQELCLLTQPLTGYYLSESPMLSEYGSIPGEMRNRYTMQLQKKATLVNAFIDARIHSTNLFDYLVYGKLSGRDKGW